MPRSIVHLYNSICELQRRVVFREDRDGIMEIAVAGRDLVREGAEELAARTGRRSGSSTRPRVFTGTELDYSLEVCEAVMDVWRADAESAADPEPAGDGRDVDAELYADQIEWFCRNVPRRETSIISLHPHNDRGTAVAATELALMAGAERVEGCLFGNGERTGNVDLVTLALNLFTQGVDPGLDLSDIDRDPRIAEECTGCRSTRATRTPASWSSPRSRARTRTRSRRASRRSSAATARVLGGAVPADRPADLGRTYEAVIRVNSQSGKGGVAYLLERDHGLDLPRGLQIEFAQVVQPHHRRPRRRADADRSGRLRAEYLTDDRAARAGLLPARASATTASRTVAGDGPPPASSGVTGVGNGPIAAFVTALRTGSDRGAGARLPRARARRGRHGDRRGLRRGRRGRRDVWGVGVHSSIVTASLRAVVSAVNRPSAPGRWRLGPSRGR